MISGKKESVKVELRSSRFLILIPVIVVLFNTSCTENEPSFSGQVLILNSPALVTPVNFKSPSLLFTADELLHLKASINSNRNSLNKAYKTLLAHCDTGLSVVTAVYTGTSPLGFLDRFEDTGSLARDLALCYCLTDDKKYASGSIRIMTAWAAGCKGISYNIEPGTGMYLARAVFPAICAYDLLKNSQLITTNDRIIIEEWFRSVYIQIKAGVQLWYDNDYYDKQLYNNHLVAHALGLLSTGFVLQDISIIQFALNSSSNPRDIYELIDGLILMKGDPPCHREGTGVPPPESGEIYDRYRHITGPVRGLQYCHLSLTEMAIIARIFTNNGIDMFKYTSSGGENLRLPFEYYSDFYRLMDSCLKSGFYCGETDRIAMAQDRPGIFELGFRYYPDSKPIKDLLNSGSYDRGSDYIPLLGYFRFYSAIADPEN